MVIPTSQLLARPAKDEWGVYDPEQAGLAALFARLDARDKITPTAAPAVRKEISDYPVATSAIGFRDE